MEVIMENNKKLFGIAALFDTPDQIIDAAEKTRDAGYKKFDVNTPYPVHGMDGAMGLKPSKLGFVTLFFGFSGAAFILLFMFYTMSMDYPMVIGGKPFFSLPAFIPVTFETTVLLAALATVFGMLAAFFNLPSNNHPLHDTEYLKAASSSKFGIIIGADDKNFSEKDLTRFFDSLGASRIDLIYYPEPESFPIFNKRFILFLLVTALLVSGGTYLTLNKLLYITPFDWMMEQERVNPQDRSRFFSDQFGMRMPVEGTVSRGFLPYPFQGEAAPAEFLNNPLLPMRDVLQLGERKYLTYCSPCHGDFGDGDARLRGQFPNPPTLHSARSREMSDGQLYHIIVNGQNIMPSYSPQTTVEERWSIVHYIRVLQRAKNALPADVQEVKKETADVETF
jgi:mono/diheme cytochrome c family protein